jgi:hypothetical protein
MIISLLRPFKCRCLILRGKVEDSDFFVRIPDLRRFGDYGDFESGITRMNRKYTVKNRSTIKFNL